MTEEVQLTEEARNDLAPHGVLRAGINEGNQVLVSARSADGGPDGVAPALAAELARRLGVPLQLVPYPSPGMLGDRAGADEWDRVRFAIEERDTGSWSQQLIRQTPSVLLDLTAIENLAVTSRGSARYRASDTGEDGKPH